MNYIITESKADKLIIEYINELFDVSEINWRSPEEYNHDDDEYYEDNTRIEFYYGAYFDDDTVFRYYTPEYWSLETEKSVEMYNNSPYLVLEEQYSTPLYGYFGDRWKPIFIEWFQENFNLPLKTVE